jgi:zinc transport system ATP-binding protein
MTEKESAHAKGKEIVSLKDVWVYYNDTPVLEGINFSVKDNTFLAIIGPNGGGKSTLLKVILGLIKPARGMVSVFGKPADVGRTYIGYLPQAKPTDLAFPISVYEVVLSGRYDRPLRKYSAADKEAALKALKDVDMAEYTDRQIGRLSGGQIQRVFLARALARDPKLLILDEPTASIDPERQKSFYALLDKLKNRMAVLFVTHDIGAVSEYFDEIACLNRKMFYHGSAEEGNGKLEETYSCPIDILGHGKPHRVLRDHERGSGSHNHGGAE